MENTAIGERFPQGWGTGNVVPAGAYRHHAVEGGRTGKRGWMIEGDGRFAVVPTNRPPANQAYRYAASAWLLLEAGSAQIKLLYFDADGRYIGKNRSHVAVAQPGGQ